VSIIRSPAATLAAAYVAANLVVVNCIPVLHHICVRVHVLSAADRRPLSSAILELVSDGGEESGSPQHADSDGLVEVELTEQCQPVWMWPMVGDLELHESIRAAAEGHATRVVRLKDMVGKTNFATHDLDMVVRLAPE